MRMGGTDRVKRLNIGLVGYGFMGRTHSNAFRQAPIFFDLPWTLVLKAVAARNEERVAMKVEFRNIWLKRY